MPDEATGIQTTLEQRRAQNALHAMRRVKGDRAVATIYRSYVDRFGPTVVMSGLGQALATERAAFGAADDRKAEGEAHDLLYQHVSAWLRSSDVRLFSTDEDLLDQLTTCDEATYLRAQSEALAWLDWHKKFCRAELPRKDS